MANYGKVLFHIQSIEACLYWAPCHPRERRERRQGGRSLRGSFFQSWCSFSATFGFWTWMDVCGRTRPNAEVDVKQRGKRSEGLGLETMGWCVDQRTVLAQLSLGKKGRQRGEWAKAPTSKIWLCRLKQCNSKYNILTLNFRLNSSFFLECKVKGNPNDWDPAF